MERIPLDIIINHIIPYTYNIQPNILLEDIKNYYTINDKHNTNVIKHELLSNSYNPGHNQIMLVNIHSNVLIIKIYFIDQCFINYE